MTLSWYKKRDADLLGTPVQFYKPGREGQEAHQTPRPSLRILGQGLRKGGGEETVERFAGNYKSSGINTSVIRGCGDETRVVNRPKKKQVFDSLLWEDR